MPRLMLNDELWSKLREIMLQHRIYDSEEIREQIKQKLSIPIIPRKKNSKTGNSDIDWGLYKYRHLVENVFARLKQCEKRFKNWSRQWKLNLIEALNPEWGDLYTEICG